MTPRTQIVAIDINAPVDALRQLILSKRHARIPVFRDDLDNIEGVVHERDLLRGNTGTRASLIHCVDTHPFSLGADERNAVAGSLRSKKTFMIALCIPDITNPFWPEVARGVQDTIEAGGYAL